jgi:hypothetical protein
MLLLSSLIITAIDPLACGNPRAIDAKQFRTDCIAFDDCVPVELQDVCRCPDGAINKADSAAYNALRNQLQQEYCRDETLRLDCGEGAAPRCVAGHCALE